MTDRALDMVHQLEAATNGAPRPAERNTKAVILAGGRGTRLAPFTSVLPKPLKITYVQEEEALGTAAPLALVEGLDETFIAMNGDVLTTLDYRALLDHHRAEKNVLTIATHRRAIKIDYGILHVDVGDRVRAFEEKPELSSVVSMGIYVMEPAVLDYLPPGQPFDFPDLVFALLDAGERIGAYFYDGLWFDIGRHEEYERAIEAWETVEELNRGDGSQSPHMRAVQ
jgi:NDP-mannose synthase